MLDGDSRLDDWASSDVLDESGWEDGMSSGLESGDILDDEGSLAEDSRADGDR